MTRNANHFRDDVKETLPGLLRVARIITDDNKSAETLVERAVIRTHERTNGHGHDWPARVRLFRSLIHEADPALLPYKSPEQREELDRTLEAVTEETSGSAVTDVLDGDIYGHGDIAEIREDIDQAQEEPSLSKLRPMTRVVLQLNSHEKFSYSDIAHVCGLDEDRVRAFLALGRKKIVTDIVNKTLSDNAATEGSSDDEASVSST